MKDIQQRLDQEVYSRNNANELSLDKPDPLFIAKRYNDEYAILLCALFAYGKASSIVQFLSTLDMSLLNKSEETIKNKLCSVYYRFQNTEDIVAVFIAFKRMKRNESLQDIFYEGYKKEHCVLEGIDALIKAIYKANPRQTQGYKFLLSSPLKRDKQGKIKHIGNAPYKRWNMFLRWMVRKDQLDLGLWEKINKEDLILPLDTHTFNVSKKLGLLKRKTYDLKSAIEITEVLKTFNKEDPIKYDFALYRIGQEKIL